MNNDPNIQRQIQLGQSWNLALGMYGKIWWWRRRKKALKKINDLAWDVFNCIREQSLQIGPLEQAQAKTLKIEDRDRKAQVYISKMVEGADTEEKWEELKKRLGEASWVIQRDKDYFKGLRLSWMAEQRNAQKA